MKQLSSRGAIESLFFVLVAVGMFAFSIGMMPGKAAAAEIINVQTRQVLPPGGNSCPLLPASSFTPYIYNNALDSFEFTIPDASYVAITGTAGNTPLSFFVMARKIDSSGNLRVHVDIPSMSLTNTVPIQITLLSSPPGKPTCLSVVSMTIGSGPLQGPIPQVNPQATPSIPASAPSSSMSPAPAGTSMNTPNSAGTTMSNATATQTSASGTGNAAVAGSVVNTMQNPIAGLCATQSAAYRLWLLLLVLYVLLVGALLWAEWPLSWAWIRTPEWLAAGILVPFILLLGFWYFSDSCRAGWFVPVIAIIIALAGLFAAFWNHPRVTQLLLIEDTNS